MSDKFSRSFNNKGKDKDAYLSEEYILNRKFNIFVRSVQDFCIEVQKSTKTEQKICQKPYHEQMKSKLE